jgi:hypothetical protein
MVSIEARLWQAISPAQLSTGHRHLPSSQPSTDGSAVFRLSGGPFVAATLQI